MSTTKNHSLNTGRKRKPAFTLAEVLITLTIIGVIAAMVIPNLWQRHFEAEMVSKLKKTYNTLNNTVAMAIRENGPADEWDIGEKGTKAGAKKLCNYIKPYLKIQKDCGTSSGCFPSQGYKPLFGNAIPNSLATNIDSQNSICKFILKDGISIGFYSWGSGSGRLANVYVDLNNKKGPNRFGVDLFMFIFYSKRKVNFLPYAMRAGLLGDGVSSSICEYNNKDTQNENNGLGCATHVLYKGNMDYLHKSIENEWKNYKNPFE